jgi:DNA-binding NtrC family response regulator
MEIGLVIKDKKTTHTLETELRSKGHQVAFYDDLREAVTARPALVFAEWIYGENTVGVLDGLRVAAEMTPPVLVVILVPTGSLALLQRARAAGAVDALFSPPDPQEILAEIEQLIGTRTVGDPDEHDRFQRVLRDGLIGESPIFREALDEMRQAARAEANVLLVGETGTGKEIFARAIHSLSPRCRGPYVAVNCAAIPAALLEGELFGAARGAFTGADKDRIGRFEVVGDGTLLLDEVGDIEFSLQTKLLRVIEQRVFQRLECGWTALVMPALRAALRHAR